MVMLGYRKPEILSESVAYTLSGACCAIFSTLKGKPRLTISRYRTPIAGIKATLMFQHLGLNNCKALHKQVLVFICFIIVTHLAVCLYTVLLRGGWYRSVSLPPPNFFNQFLPPPYFSSQFLPPPYFFGPFRPPP